MDFLMPKLSDTMEEGTVLRWLKDDGAPVAKGEPIVEIETDKADMMVEAPADGALRIVAQVGDSLPIGAPIATIGGASAPPAPASPEPPVAAASEPAQGAGTQEPAEGSTGIPTADDGTGASIGLEVRPPEDYPAAHDDDEPDVSAPTEVAVAPRSPAPAEGSVDKVRASPLARRLADELGIDLTGIHGTGPAGRIVREDVETAAAGRSPAAPPAAAASAPATTPARATPSVGEVRPGERIPFTRLQRTIARRMAESKPGAPHFYLERDVDVTALIGLRKELVAASPEGRGPSVNDLIIRAVALAAAERPDAISRFDGDARVAASGVHVGVAVAVPGGLMVPVVRDADTKRVAQLAAEVGDLARRCRDGTITPPELEGSVITISNLGMFGIDRFAAVINPPEAAILAVGRAKPTAVVLDGEIQVRDVMTVTLSVDHRTLYGAEAATFLGRIAELLEHPGALVL
jgi:pyruvate dehydrogenase E2 component (dihydrolipoamide acetyltransferase)